MEIKLILICIISFALGFLVSFVWNWITDIRSKAKMGYNIGKWGITYVKSKISKK